MGAYHPQYAKLTDAELATHILGSIVPPLPIVEELCTRLLDTADERDGVQQELEEVETHETRAEEAESAVEEWLNQHDEIIDQLSELVVDNIVPVKLTKDQLRERLVTTLETVLDIINAFPKSKPVKHGVCRPGGA